MDQHERRGPEGPDGQRAQSRALAKKLAWKTASVNHVYTPSMCVKFSFLERGICVPEGCSCRCSDAGDWPEGRKGEEVWCPTVRPLAEGSGLAATETYRCQGKGQYWAHQVLRPASEAHLNA